MTMGTVKFFNATKGFGFISPEGGGSDLFVHASAAELAGMPALVEGQLVTFEIEMDTKGSKAVNLGSVPLDDTSAPASEGTHLPSGVSEITIYHNPDCETSRKALTEIRLAGFEPLIVEYLQTPPSGEEIKRLALRANLGVRDLVRKIEPLYQELRLDAPEVSDDDILDAMAKNPVLINRPIVATENFARLCRPSSTIKAFLSEAAIR
jgi:arsenate reductase